MSNPILFTETERADWLRAENDRLRDELNRIADDPARAFSLRERGFVTPGPQVTPEGEPPLASASSEEEASGEGNEPVTGADSTPGPDAAAEETP